MTQTAETNRDRVRRLVLEPLGFRHPRKVGEAEGRAALDAIADDLAWLSDDHLRALVDVMRSKGEGSSRDFWPSRAAFVGCAEWLSPRPLEMCDALVRWFRSVEGPRAAAEGTLVETWLWFERHKRPPLSPLERKRIADEAAAAQRRLILIGERERDGRGVAAEDREWRRWYLARRDKCLAQVPGLSLEGAA